MNTQSQIEMEFNLNLDLQRINNNLDTAINKNKIKNEHEIRAIFNWIHCYKLRS